MKTVRLFTLLIFLACPCLSMAAQSDSLDFNGETPATKAERMEWFADAKLGIFIHWGLYSVDGVSESWGFYNEQIPYGQYMAQEKGFTASEYDPRLWARLIAESGARYTVLTTKHHEGMALWDTGTGSRSVVHCTPAARDLIAPFAAAVREEGLKLGLYYSLLDWSHDDYPVKTKSIRRYTDDPARWESFCRFNLSQINELNSLFRPDLIWFDGDWEQSAESWHAAEIVEMLRSGNPGIIINSRIQGYGDYGTPEQGMPVNRPKDEYWELCYTMNDSWGYYPTDTNYKSANILLRTLVDCLSKGGNLLLDIGPREDGSIVPEQVAILKAFGRWTSKYAKAIYGTRAGIPARYFQGYTSLSKEGDVLYLYLPYKPTGPVEVKGLYNKVLAVEDVASGQPLEYKLFNKLSWRETPGNLYISIPDSILDRDISVVAIKLDGPVRLYED